MDEAQDPVDTQGATAAPDVANQVMDTLINAPSGWGANVQPVENHDDDATQAPDDYDDDATQAPDDYDDDATQAPEDDDEPAANEFAGATVPSPNDEAGGISDDDATQAPPDSPEPTAEPIPEKMTHEQPVELEHEPEPAPNTALEPESEPDPDPEPEAAVEPPSAEADNIEVLDAVVDAAFEPIEAEVDGDTLPDTIQRIDAAMEAAFEAERASSVCAAGEDEETRPAAVDEPEAEPEPEKVRFAEPQAASPVAGDAGGAWRAAGAMYYDTQKMLDTQLSVEPTPSSDPGATAPVAAEAPASEAPEPEAAPMEMDSEPEPDAPAEALAPPAYSAEELRSMNVGCDAPPVEADRSALEGAEADEALAAPESDPAPEAKEDEESEPLPMTAPSHPDVAMPVVHEIEMRTPIQMDETDEDDADLRECGGDWTKAMPPPKDPVEAPDAEEVPATAPEEPSSPAAEPSEPTQDTGTTAATVIGARRRSRASTATADTVVTRPRRAAAAATAAKAAEAEAAKKRNAEENARTKAKRSPAAKKRGRASRAPPGDDGASRATKTRRGGAAAGARPFKVLLSTAFDPATTRALEAKVKKLGGVVTASAREFTHFLTAPPLGRSKHVLCALAAGAPVVLPSWLDASARAGAFVGAEDHLCRHPAFEKKQGFDLPHVLQRARARPLLEGVNAHVVPSKASRSGRGAAGARSTRVMRRDAATPETTEKSVEAMLAVVLPRAGATLASAKQVDAVSDRDLASENWLVVKTPTSDAAACSRLIARGAKVVAHEAILSGIVRHKL